MDEANAFLNGGTVVAALAISLFFLRFWQGTRDRFFAIFALALFMFGINRLILVVIDDSNENTTYVYVARLVAFLLILGAVVDKNRGATRQPSGRETAS